MLERIGSYVHRLKSGQLPPRSLSRLEFLALTYRHPLIQKFRVPQHKNTRRACAKQR